MHTWKNHTYHKTQQLHYLLLKGKSLEALLKRVRFRITVDALASIHEFSLNSAEMSLVFRSTKNKLYKCLLRKCLRILSLGFKKFKENAIQRQADIKVRVAIQKVSAANHIYEMY